VNAQSIACRLEEPDGTPLAAGLARMQEASREALITALDLPGRVVQRCLLGGLHDVRLRLGDAAPVAAHLERIGFDPALGRTCTLRLVA
jgi:hypothetical protein